jgi:DNA-binding LacI/PurR family transcriptional regulator
VNVVGFDDVDLAAYVDPPLTTVAQATTEMGRWAVTRLTDELADRAASRAGGNGAARDGLGEAAHVVLPVSLRVREATGPASR